MNLKVSPTRQELLRLKKRLVLARSGHRLLKHKMESLLREFLGQIAEIQKLQKEIEEKLPQALLCFFRGQSILGARETESLLSHIPHMQITTKEDNIMGVEVEEYTLLNQEEIKEAPFSEMSANKDIITAREELLALQESIIKYATMERKIRMLAREIESTRRRVNSLEHVYIPAMESSCKYIYNKLEESERFARTVLIKLKSYST